jgi:Flp pilus assembly secretin CpaC
VALVLLGFCLPATAEDLLDRVKNQEINQIIRLKAGRSKVLKTPFALTRISVADPDVADIILISEREVYINALAPGVTNITMWGKSRFTSATVTVEADLTLLKEKLHQILPKEKIGAEAAGDTIVLSGEVSGPVAQSTALGDWTAAGTLWTVFLDLLKQQNLGRVLAEPNLVTTSGQKASFLAGGEFPIPVPQSGIGGAATITIEFKKYGVQLEFTPVVLDDGKIAVRVHPIVSELDYTNSLTTENYVVPGLLTREMDTHVEVHDGQTFSIAGLLQDNSRNIINKFPVLGDIPVLGVLFRSTQYQKRETELVALVTPRLVKPMPPGAARLSTDKWIDPSDVDVYLLGLEQGRQKPAAAGPGAAPAAPLPPEFGHQSLN